MPILPLMLARDVTAARPAEAHFQLAADQQLCDGGNDASIFSLLKYLFNHGRR